MPSLRVVRFLPIVALLAGPTAALARHHHHHGAPPYVRQNNNIQATQPRQQRPDRFQRDPKQVRSFQRPRTNAPFQAYKRNAPFTPQRQQDHDRWAAQPGDSLARDATTVQAAASSPQMPLGLPKGPAIDKGGSDLMWIARPQYVSLFDHKLNGVRMVSWTTRKSDLGAADRSDDFRPDPMLPSSWHGPTPDDYHGSGYTRGHMCRSGERTDSHADNASTYLMTNMVPQAANNNAGPWNQFENYYRYLVSTQNKTAVVVAGGAYSQTPKTIGADHVAVPESTFKIVALLDPGQTARDITPKTRIVSVLMPNDNSKIQMNDDWSKYRVSVSQIEKATGLQFFDNLAPNVRDALKNTVDHEALPPLDSYHESHDHSPKANAKFWDGQERSTALVKR